MMQSNFVGAFKSKIVSSFGELKPSLSVNVSVCPSPLAVTRGKRKVVGIMMKMGDEEETRTTLSS